MINIDIYRQKFASMSNTSSVPFSAQRSTRNADYRNTQVSETDCAGRKEANNNLLPLDTTPECENPVLRREGKYLQKGSGNQAEDMTSDLHAQWPTDYLHWSGEGEMPDLEKLPHPNSASIISFQSNLSDSFASVSYHSSEESKEEEISLLLSKVRSQSRVEASKILLAMSSTVENCIAMRNCGCLPMVIQLLHYPDENSNTCHMVQARRIHFEVRERASQVLHNLVFAQPDDKKCRREARVLRLLEQIRDYCDQLMEEDVDDNRNAGSVEQLGSSVAALMKLSFDEDHRHAMCQLGGLQAVAELLQVEQEVHGCTNDPYCTTIRRYSGMVLTNLTFGDGANKALLCSMRPFMEALVAQLYSPTEDLRQVTASVLRNLSWRADPASKRMLREVGSVTLLVRAAMEAEKESTLKSILSALWNLSAHCSGNKADICHVDGALAFLVSTLTYRSRSKNLSIVENGGGILRNISSHIAIQNDYRVILRRHNCLQILLQHLKSPSLTVVSNACGTLWNLSARNAADQRALWEMGAVGMLKKLIHSKHKMISMGSSAALKNLLSAKPPSVGLCVYGDNYRVSDDVPSLMVRKQKALNTELDQSLTETYDMTDSPKTSPAKVAHNDKQNRSRRHMSPSARYMTNQKLRNELTLPNRSADTSIVVEEKHNGAFQVTKNAKQALSYKQQRDLRTGGPLGEKKSAKTSHEPPALGDRHSFSSADRGNPDLQANEVRSAYQKETRTSEPKRTTDSAQSKIPLPRSFNSQRSQSASPVAQRRSQLRPPVDITVTHPKWAWSSGLEKDDVGPEQARKEEDGSDEVRVYRTEDTPPRLSLAASVDELIEENARCSLNIKTSTNVKMIQCHPLLANASAHRAEEEERGRPSDEAATGKTVDFSVQSDYDIDETLSMMSRSSSVASISSFDQQSLHEDFLSDLSNKSSCIGSSSEALDCQTAPTSPLKQLHEDRRTDETCEKANYESAVQRDDEAATNDESHSASNESSRSRATSVEDMSPADRMLLEECIRAGMPQPPTRCHRDAVEKHPKACTQENGRVKLKSLEVKEAEFEIFSDSEEKGKEDERKAEKTRLFRIPESPIDKRTIVVESSKIENLHGQEFYPLAKTFESVNANVESKGNYRFEKNPQLSKTIYESNRDKVTSNQLGFLMNHQKNASEASQATDKDSSTEDFRDSAHFEEQDFSVLTEDSENSFFTCYSDTHSLDNNRSTSKRSESPREVQFSKLRSSGELSEKDVDCSEMDDDTMIKSSIIDEAKEIAQALLNARVDSTEDMTVSTLSCLSDIDNARPPSIMAEIGCMSMNNSCASEENLKVAVTRECQKIFGSKQLKKSLLRELQIGRLTSDVALNDHSKCSNESAENLSMKSSCASDLLGNVNPPSLLDEISLTASTGSLEGSDLEGEPLEKYRHHDSMSERLHDAAAMTKLYAKELSHITGNTAIEPESNNMILDVKGHTIVPEVTEVTIADATEIGCDTIGSDTELDDDFPCDDEDFCSETFHMPQQSSLKKENAEEGSTENLTVTLTDEHPKLPTTPRADFQKQSICFMTAEQLRALQENADMILNTLRDVEISDEETGKMFHGDMLEDETMSLVSNESDEEFLSPDNHQRITHTQKTSPKNDSLASPTCNGMILLPHCTGTAAPPKSVAKKSSLPQFSPRKKHNRQPVKYSELSNQLSNRHSEMRELVTDLSSQTNTSGEKRDGIDTRTFTRKRSAIPRDVNDQGPLHPAYLKSPTASSSPSLPTSPKIASTDPDKAATAGHSKNPGKLRSKSAADSHRYSKMQPAAGRDENGRLGDVPKSPLSRGLDDEKTSVRRPSSLAIQPNSPRQPFKSFQKQPSNEACPRTVHASGIPKPKAQALVLSRIPTPARLEH